MSYDEDINLNNFFIQLKTNFFHLIEESTEQKWIICVPKSCLNIPKLTENDFRDHILINKGEKNQKIYSTLNGQKFRVKNGKIVQNYYEDNEIVFNDSENVNSFDNKKVFNESVSKNQSVSVQILFEETFYMDDLKSYQIWCIDNFLNENQIIPNVTLNFIKKNEINSFNDASNFLFQTFHKSDTLSKINLELQNFLLENSLNEISIEKLKSLVQNLYAKCISNIVMEKTETEDSNVKISLETYIQNSIHKFVFGVILTNLYIEDSTFNKVIKNFNQVQIRQLDIKSETIESIIAAKQCLSKISSYSTFLDKVNCLKKTFMEINCEKMITSDELLSIFVFLILKSNVPNWESNLTYLKEFKIENNNIAFNDFLIATLEASIEYIKTGGFKTDGNKVQNWGYDFTKFDSFRIKNEVLRGKNNNTFEDQNHVLGATSHNFEFKNQVKSLNSVPKSYNFNDEIFDMKNSVLKLENYGIENHIFESEIPNFGAKSQILGHENHNNYKFETKNDVLGQSVENHISVERTHKDSFCNKIKTSKTSKNNKFFLLKPEKNCNTPDDIFFECIATGNDFKLKSLLKNIDISDEKTELVSESKVELCHPLCCCEKCENAFETKNGSIFMKNNNGQTLLHYACLFGQSKIVEIILSHGGEKLINSKDFKGQTPLHNASSKGYQDIFLLLLDKGAILNQVDNDKNLPLHLASLNGHLGIVKTIIFSVCNNENFDINAINLVGDTALHHGARWGYFEICQILIENGAKLIQNNLGKTPLDLALNSKICQILINKNLVENSKMETNLDLGSNSKNCDVLIEPKNFDAFRNLDSNPNFENVNVSLEGSNSKNCVVLESEPKNNPFRDSGSNFENVNVLLKETNLKNCDEFRNLDSNPNFENVNKNVSLKKSNLKNSDILGSKKVSFRNLDCNFEKVQNDRETFDFSDDFKTSEILKKEKQKRKAELLLKAVTYDDIPLICFYLGLPLSKTINNCKNCHPLCNCENCQNVNINSSKNCDPLDINLSDSNGFTALHMASLHGQVDIVKLLLANSANVNLMTKKLQTPLHLAAQTDRIEIVRLLTEIEYNCKIDLQDYKGNTPLHLACIARNLDIVKMLISKGADLNVQNLNGEKPIDISEGKVLQFLKNFVKNEE